MSGSVNPFPNKPWFLRVCSVSLLKTLWEKEKLLIISPFPTVFSIHSEHFLVFSSTLKLSSANFSVWQSLKFVVWERVNTWALITMSIFTAPEYKQFIHTNSTFLNKGLSVHQLVAFSSGKAHPYIVWNFPIIQSAVHLHDSVENCLTFSSICTHFNTLKKTDLGKHCGKSNFTFFHNVFLWNLNLKILYQPHFSCRLQFLWIWDSLKIAVEGMG